MRAKLALLAFGVAVAAAPGFEVPVALRGPVTVHLLPAEGRLTVTVVKRDLNIYDGPDVLRVVLLDPLRREVGAVVLPDDEGRGAEQTASLDVPVEVAGTYRLSFAAPTDLVYGLRANAERGVIESPSPLFNDAKLAGRLYFEPPPGQFALRAAALHDGGLQVLPLRDAAGAEVATIDLTQKGAGREQELFGPRSGGGYVAGARIELPAGVGDRSSLWHFEVAHLDLRLQLDGVRYWTTDPAAWLPVGRARWMLLPYHTTRYLRPGETTRIVLTLRNRTGGPAGYRLTPTVTPPLRCRIVPPAAGLSLADGRAAEVALEVEAPPETPLDRAFEGHVTATVEGDPALTASVGFVVSTAESPVGRPLNLPIVLERYRHERAQYGYNPDYVPNEVYFDRANRPVIRDRFEHRYPTTALTFLEAGRWVARPFVEALSTAIPGYRGAYFGGGFLGAKVAFDRAGGAYTIVSALVSDGPRRSALLYTPDEGRSYQVVELPGDAFDLEPYNGHNDSETPPILTYRTTGPHPGEWASVNELLLFVPRLADGRVALGEPVVVSERCIGSCQHSGGPPSTATRDGRTHVVWGECTEPGESPPGVPTYVATFDHGSGRLSPKVLVGYGPPVDDVHNVPGICLDSQGCLHVITGAHSEAFTYTRSLRPNDSQAGWTAPEPVLEAGYVDKNTDADGRGRQTYLSLVCGPDDTLYIAYRQWRQGVDPYHDGLNYAALSFQKKPKDEPWGPAVPLVVPPVPGYSIYYHKLTLDRRGRLFLSYSYYTADTTYQDDYPELYHHAAVITSADGGETWKLAETADLAP